MSIKYPEDKFLHHLLSDAAQEMPHKTAFYFYDNRLTFQELDNLSRRFASALTTLGVRKGDRVALLLPNCPQFIISYYGALKAGCIVVPFNPRYKEHEIEHQLKDCGAEILIALDLVYDAAEKVVGRTAVQHVMITHMIDYLPPLYRMFAPARGIQPRKFPGTLKFLDLLNKAKPTEPVLGQDPREDVAVLLYTGGTTGVPKGVMLTHYNLVVNAMQTVAWGQIKPEDTMLAVLPFFHSYGMTVCMNSLILARGSVILLPRFDAKEVLDAIEKYRPTHFPGVPTIYIALLNHPDIRKYNLKSIRYCISGAAPLPVEVARRWSEVTEGALLVEGYGLSETSPVTHCNPLDNLAKVRYGSIGITLPDTHTKVMDIDTGLHEVRVGETGEIVIKGPQVMKGYWNRSEETALTLRDGWLYTGDIGYVDEDGYFYVVDRKKEMINVGGLKALPREIEEVLYQHPSVKLASVVGIPDPKYGEIPKAYVVLKDGFDGKVTQEELITHCRTNLTSFKVPRQVEFRKELPTTLVGKVLRRQLREEEVTQMRAAASAAS